MVGSDLDIIGHDPMGVSGGSAPAPTYMGNVSNALGNVGNSLVGLPPNWPSHKQQMLAQQAQTNWPSQAAQQYMGGAGASWQASADFLVHVIPLQEVGREKIRQLIAQLPMRAMRGIAHVRLYDNPLRFVVTYSDMRTLEINAVNEFPAAEHISRILLDLP